MNEDFDREEQLCALLLRALEQGFTDLRLTRGDRTMVFFGYGKSPEPQLDLRLEFDEAVLDRAGLGGLLATISGVPRELVTLPAVLDEGE
jgi:hypothetical protein